MLCKINRLNDFLSHRNFSIHFQSFLIKESGDFRFWTTCIFETCKSIYRPLSCLYPFSSSQSSEETPDSHAYRFEALQIEASSLPAFDPRSGVFQEIPGIHGDCDTRVDRILQALQTNNKHLPTSSLHAQWCWISSL